MRNPDGSLKVVGYDPEFGFYQNTLGRRTSRSSAAKWFDAQRQVEPGEGSGLVATAQVAEEPVDYYGHDKLVRWQAGAGDEFSASHAFETGKLAMMMDGEWRVSFIAAEHPELQYGTAPMPVDGAKPNLYGGGYINGTIIGIPKNGKNRDAAWALVKYLTTNDHALAKFSNGIRNVPSTTHVLGLEGAQAGRELRDLLEDLRQPALGDDADHRRRRGVPGHVPELPRASGSPGRRRTSRAGSRTSTSRSTRS